MEITLQLESETAHELHQRQSSSVNTRELLTAVDEMQVKLEPVHPGIADSELAKYFSVHVQDGEAGNKIRERLAGCRGVEAAYVKPAAELP